MKRTALIILLTALTQTSMAQDSATSNRLFQVLQSYYNIKDALIAGDNKAASGAATSFIKNLNGISYTVISEGNVNTLLQDACTIADAKNIDKQRAAFSNLAINMVEVAKSLKLTTQPVYIQYCPMKKTYWLSNEKQIKNPYYGSSMLTCGNVTETIQ